MASLPNILKKPIYTEKSLAKATRNVYTFEVGRDISKDDIKKAVAEIFGVQVKSVRTFPKQPKTKRVGKARYEVKTRGSKKTEVETSGKIDLWEVPEEKEVKETKGTTTKKEAKDEKDKREEGEN